MEREAFSIWKDSFPETFNKLSPFQRLDVANLLLKLCEVKELTYLTTEMDGLLVRNFTRLLPTEVVNEILSYLDPTSLLNCCQVQRSWNEDITQSCDLWKKSCIDIGCKISKTDMKVNGGKFWKEKFVQGSKCFHKLKSHQCHDTLELCGHKERVYCLQYDGNDKLYSGSGNGQICIWNISSGSLFKTFTVDPCSDIVLTTSLLYVGSFTCTISSWDIENGRHCKSYRGHTGVVFSLSLNEAHDLLLSGSADQTARLWKISTCETLRVFHGHDCWVKKVLLSTTTFCNKDFMHGEIMAVTMGEIDIRIWKSDSNNCLAKLDDIHPNKTERSQNILINDTSIFCSCQGVVLEWSIIDYTLTRKFPLSSEKSFCVNIGRVFLLQCDFNGEMKLALRNRQLQRNSICYTDTEDVVSLVKIKGFDKIGNNTNNIVLSGFSFMDGFERDLPPKEQCLVAAGMKSHNILIFKLKI